MTIPSKARLGMICLVIFTLLAGCGKATPTAAPTIAATPTAQPTDTPAPTETPRPTDTPAQPVASPTGPAASAGTATVQAPAAGQAASGGAVADKYQYLGQDIADRTQILPNRTVTITWTVKNIGANAWTKQYNLRYFSGPKPQKDAYAFTKDVPPQATINFIVTFTTPADPGDYDLWFKLTNAEGKNFGDLDLVFTVTNNPQKATATPKK